MPVRWIALGVAAYLAFAIALFPANAAYRWLAPDEVRLSGVHGTVWSGGAALGSVGPLGLHDVQWRLPPWPLLVGRTQARIETRLGDGFLQGEVRIGRGRVVVADVTATCGLHTLTSVLPIAGIHGQLSLQLAELVMRDGRPDGVRGQLNLGRLTVPSLVGGDPIALGSYSVTLSGADGLRGTFQDRNGPLQVQGSAMLTVEGDYEISGLVRVRPEAGAALRRGVDLLSGSPDAQGMRAFSFAGTI